MAASLKHSYGNKEYSFVNKDVSKFVCAICQEILYEPVQTSCGHLFCGRCLKRIRSKKCPSCRAEFVREPIEDKFNEREIRNLIVKCQNSSRGCEWEGELGNVESHQNGVCGYQLVQCGNKCGAEIERRDVEKHEKDHCELRMYECPYCTTVFSLWSNKYIGTYKKVTSEHFKECYGFLLDCPNNCGGKEIRRGDMSSHLCACPEEVVPCRYQSLGCKVRLPRKQMKHHLKDKDSHLELSLFTVGELTQSLNMLTQQMDAVMLVLSQQGIKVPSISPPEREQSWLKVDQFPRFPPCIVKINIDGEDAAHILTQCGYKLKLTLRNVPFLSIFSRLFTSARDQGKSMICQVSIECTNEEYMQPLVWPIKLEATVLLLNTEEDKDHIPVRVAGTLSCPGDVVSEVARCDADHVMLKCSKPTSYFVRVKEVKISQA